MAGILPSKSMCIYDTYNNASNDSQFGVFCQTPRHCQPDFPQGTILVFFLLLTIYMKPLGTTALDTSTFFKLKEDKTSFT